MTHALIQLASSLQRTISVASSELRQYDAEIESYRKELDRLILERDTLASYADGCRSAFAPIRRMPTEILADIFNMCSPVEIYGLADDTTPQEEILRLSHRHHLRFSQVGDLIRTHSSCAYTDLTAFLLEDIVSLVQSRNGDPKTVVHDHFRYFRLVPERDSHTHPTFLARVLVD